MQNLIHNTDEPIYETDPQTENRLAVPGWGRNGLGVWV